jgi:hypothetical protein
MKLHVGNDFFHDFSIPLFHHSISKATKPDAARKAMIPVDPRPLKA